MMRQRIAGGARRNWLVGAALVAAAAMPLSAQGTGNGYLFGVPTAGHSVQSRAAGNPAEAELARFLG